jgi:ADP-ribosyl-[dinitrogen reductase] hydrolase
MISLDKIRGMFMGAFLGDARGFPYEFKCNSKTPYTGILEYKPFYISQYQGRKEYPVGSTSDDTALTLVILRQIILDKGYNKDNVTLSYMRWANDGNPPMGKNTRALFKGVKTLKGYQKRISKVLELPVEKRSQSNGSLMRCSPLSLVWNNQCVIDDCYITNPNPVNCDCNLIYITAIRLALIGTNPNEIFEQIKNLAQTKEVKEVLLQVENRSQRDIIENKGWCLHGLYCALLVMLSYDNYSDAMKWVIGSNIGSDTDTNACIAGALLGAIIGYNNLEEQESYNIKILLTAETSGEYVPKDFMELTEKIHKLGLL